MKRYAQLIDYDLTFQMINRSDSSLAARFSIDGQDLIYRRGIRWPDHASRYQINGIGTIFPTRRRAAAAPQRP